MSAESPSAPPLAPLDEIEARANAALDGAWGPLAAAHDSGYGPRYTADMVHDELALCAALRAERAERERCQADAAILAELRLAVSDEDTIEAGEVEQRWTQFWNRLYRTAHLNAHDIVSAAIEHAARAALSGPETEEPNG